MKLYLENIGNFKNAEIEFNGITVIAGKNGTGKTTISKSLYGMFNGLNDIDKKVRDSKVREIESIIDDFLYDLMHFVLFEFEFAKDVANEIVKRYRYEELPCTQEMSLEIKKMLLDGARKYNFEQSDIDKITKLELQNMDFVGKIKHDVLSVDNDILKSTIMKDYLNKLFYDNIKNQTTQNESRIELEIKKQNNTWNDNSTLIYETKFKNKAIYINNPMIIDELFERGFSTSDIMKADLLNKLKGYTVYEDDPFYSIKIEKVHKMISSIIGGDINKSPSGLNVKMSNNVELDIRNLATGLKTFAVINQLFKNRALDKRDVLLLDEPEVHLHPTMQLQLAELIVILQQEFEFTVLINTHSLHFVEAIEVYSKKYDIAESCKFYNAVNVDGTNIIEDVSDNLNIIYNELDEALDIVVDAIGE